MKMLREFRGNNYSHISSVIGFKQWVRESMKLKYDYKIKKISHGVLGANYHFSEYWISWSAKKLNAKQIFLTNFPFSLFIIIM